MNAEILIPLPINEIYAGGKQIQAGKRSRATYQLNNIRTIHTPAPSRPIEYGAQKCAKGAIHLLLGGAYAGLSILADRTFPFGNTALHLVGGMLSLPATFIGNGFKAIYYGLKILPSAARAKNIGEIGKSTVYLGVGYLLLLLPSYRRIQNVGLIETHGVNPMAEKIGTKASTWL